jgi:predicted lipoprotein with Yx(FWY)xxD motif
MRTQHLASALLVVLPLVAACGSEPEASTSPATTSEASSDPPAPSPSRSPSRTPTASASESTGTRIVSGDSPYGQMLYDDADQAIYIWEVEDSSRPACYGDCAVAWPPVLTDGKPLAQGEVDPALLGTARRRDGSTQVTYNGHPLYYYAHEDPGEVECHNVSTHGGLWWVIRPDGNRAP